MAAGTDTPMARSARVLVLLLAALAAMPMAAANQNPAPAVADPVRVNGPQQAGKGRPSGAPAALPGPPTHEWHDGVRRRALRIDTSLQADFGAGTEGRPVLRAAEVNGRALSALQSAVLVDDAGQLRALPGGVLLVLKTSQTATAAQLLFNQVGVRPSRQLTDTLWLIESPAGLASLELANRLHDSGLFASAQPNWWVDRARK